MGSIEWWWEQLNIDKDWLSMPPDMKKNLTKKLQRAASELADIGVTEVELNDMVEKTDIAIVFDSILRVWEDFGSDYRCNRFLLLKRLRQYVNSKRRVPKIQYHVEHSNSKRGRPVKPVSLEEFNKYNLLNFSNSCDVCGGKIRRDNKTNRCSNCQKNGNGAKVELNSRGNERPNNKRT